MKKWLHDRPWIWIVLLLALLMAGSLATLIIAELNKPEIVKRSARPAPSAIHRTSQRRSSFARNCSSLTGADELDSRAAPFEPLVDVWQPQPYVSDRLFWTVDASFLGHASQ